ncbi:MAG: hypothetical protein R3D86_14115 [Emcibacteraceae bacterium]
MDFDFTIGMFCVAVFLAAMAFYKSRQPAEPGKLWAIPWNGVLFISILGILLTAGHLMAIVKS